MANGGVKQCVATIAALAFGLTEWRADLVSLYFDTLSESDPDLLREDEKTCFRPNEDISKVPSVLSATFCPAYATVKTAQCDMCYGNTDVVFLGFFVSEVFICII